MRHEQQRRALLHKNVTVWVGEQEVSVALEIVPDEYEPYGELRAFDTYGALLAQVRVSQGFRSTRQARSAGSRRISAGRIEARGPAERPRARQGSGTMQRVCYALRACN